MFFFSSSSFRLLPPKRIDQGDEDLVSRQERVTHEMVKHDGVGATHRFVRSKKRPDAASVGEFEMIRSRSRFHLSWKAQQGELRLWRVLAERKGCC